MTAGVWAVNAPAALMSRSRRVPIPTDLGRRILRLRPFQPFRSLKRNLQEPVERELERFGFFLTHRVSPVLAGFLLSEPAEIKARRLFCRVGYYDQIEIRGSRPTSISRPTLRGSQ
jgi:hypothetical protein